VAAATVVAASVASGTRLVPPIDIRIGAWRAGAEVELFPGESMTMKCRWRGALSPRKGFRAGEWLLVMKLTSDRTD
jgi:hypothetical protein